jgi:hypothetical protein
MTGPREHVVSAGLEVITDVSEGTCMADGCDQPRACMVALPYECHECGGVTYL